ncbi:hypothetical protein CN553_12555 [Bacillus cereus]|uniref:Uncharacterized protein n=1 Tax=Bacillus cereus TaxID=1396 RepID=A0A9X6YMJ4_BACCE|nr:MULTISPECIES: hypothetical protein [Bacillus]EOO44258.1 hypothetical protein ICK_06515 [Bacillus cereus BAG1X2-2]EOP00343.1 hypothetical protein ICO_06299 [Bacillus cereus BAG2O-1]PEN97861.1 hypothetical protein CN553_12555 [Bacillus cereus]HDR7066882.1 hypothetical protein [Bacillus cereus]
MLFRRGKSNKKEKEFKAIENMLIDAKMKIDSYNLDLKNVEYTETKELLNREIRHLREFIDTLKITYTEYEKNMQRKER